MLSWIRTRGVNACLLLLVFAMLSPRIVWSQRASADEATQAAPDAAPTHYMGREIAQTMHYLGAPWLTRDERQREEDCALMLKKLDVREGMTVCDMGCGNGFYTLQLAKMVGPKGRVYAVDIQPEMLRLMEARAAEEGLENIESVLGDVDNPKLPADSIDLILCVDVYHEFSHPEPMLGAMRNSLKKAGAMVLVEFREEDPEVPIKPLHKMSKKQIIKEMDANQLKLVRQFDGLPWQHMMFFGRNQ